ncbi:MAG: L,D-transpeptidase family protein [Polyangiaceae bacterium]|nr:L,D-transpeptidase family protein [Polyangiaceae bacterium]
MARMRWVALLVVLPLGAATLQALRSTLEGLPWSAIRGETEHLRHELALAVAVRSAQAAVLERSPDVAKEIVQEPSTTPIASSPSVAKRDEVPDANPPTADLTVPLLALARETPIYAAPTRQARKVGYARTGSVLVASVEKVEGRGCSGGWQRVRPFGFVCGDERVSSQTDHPVRELATRPADRLASLPYVYVRVKQARVPLYTRIPSPPERAALEGSARGALDRAWRDAFVEPLPQSLALGRPTPTSHGYARSATSLALERTRPNGSFALSRLFEVGGQRFGMTPDLLLLPLDRVTEVPVSTFSGVKIRAGQSLPVAFATSHSAYLYDIDVERGAIKLARKMNYREGAVASDQRRFFGGKEYVRFAEGLWARADQLRFVRSSPAVGSRLKREHTFIDVSLADQSLVAYEDGRPVFATLISSGVPEERPGSPSHETVSGQFRIHTKHVTAQMTGDEAGDEYSLPDVPYVQYFQGSFAFHAAYWHDAFGTPKSHGCINLSPEDARFLFGWTEPKVPPGWHGAMASLGTLVSIHE